MLLGEVTGIDKQVRRVIVDDAHIPYDYLIIATGARHSYFGKDQWAAHAPGIKSLDDATRVRADILLAFERAEVETDPVRRQALLTFAVIGGGPIQCGGEYWLAAAEGSFRLAAVVAAHMHFLIGFRNRLSVAIRWAWSYVTWQRGVRLITGHDREVGDHREAA